MIARRTGKAALKAGPPPAEGGDASQRSPLSTDELAQFRNTLLAKRAELLEDMGAISGDRAEDPSDLLDSEWELLRKIDAALARIESGTYGICQATGKPITKARLNACPWAVHCIEYARKHERPRSMLRQWSRLPDDPAAEQPAPDPWDLLRRE